MQHLETKKLNTLEETVKVSTSLYNEIQPFLKNTANLDHIVVYKNTKGDQFNNKISEIVQHIANHGTYHRGNISAMIRQMGYEGTSTDYIGFLRNN